MAYVVIKRGKFLKSSNYCTGFPVQYFWTHNEAEARRYSDDHKVYAENDANVTKGKLVKRTNTKLELRALGRVRIQERERRIEQEAEEKRRQEFYANRLS